MLGLPTMDTPDGPEADDERPRRRESSARIDAAGRCGVASHPVGEVIHRYLGAAGYPRSAGGPAASRPTPPAPRFTGLVLVGVDDAPDSHVAVHHAAIEAELHGWDLRLLHVPTGGAAGDPGARLFEQMTERVYARSRTFAVTSRLAVGTPEAMLLAEAGRADLVVVGGRHGAGAAARRAGPVLVVRVPGWPPGSEFAQRPILAGIEPGYPGGRLRAGRGQGPAVRRGAAARRAVPGPAGKPARRHRPPPDPPKRPDRRAGRGLGPCRRRGDRTRSGRRCPARFGGSPVLPHARCPVFLVG